MPAKVTERTMREMEASLDRYFGKIAADKIDQYADRAREVVEQTLKTEQEARPGQAETTTVGTGAADARTALTAFVEDETGTNVADKMNMDFFLRIAREVALGAGQHIARNMDQTRIDAFPALELLRVYEREVPRGEKRVHGQIVDDPENSWEERWKAAADESGDADAARCLEDSGRMVALKSSGIWQALGDGAGGYEDTLGNDFAPFAFNSGYDQDEVARDDAVELGLMGEDDEAEGADIEPEKLISLPTEASRALSCGAPIGNQNARKHAQTDTKEFKAWFGDSKVVDGDGKPLVVYHGTDKDFESFRKRDTGKETNGLWFTTDKEMASSFGSYGSVIPAYVRVEKPAPFGKDLEWAEKNGYDGAIIKDKDGISVVVAFNPNQIKSAIGNSGKFDPEDARITASRAVDDFMEAITA